MSRAANGQGSIYKTEKGWRGAILLNGRRRYVTGATKKDVNHKLQALKIQANQGFVQTSRSPRLGEWIQHWLDATAPLDDLTASKQAKRHSIKTDSNYRDIIKFYLPAWLSSITLNKLTPEHLEETYKDLSKKHSAGTVYRLHAIIRAALTFAVKRGHVPQNAAKLVITPPQPKTSNKRTAMSRADQQAFRTVLEQSRSKTRWEIGLTLGARPGETLGLEWFHIDFDERSITIEQQLQSIDGELRIVPYTKNATSSRKIPMPEFIADLLRAHREQQMLDRMVAGDKWVDWEDRAFVFTSAARPGRPITPDGDRTQWNKLVEKAGLPAMSPYTARHTAASEMIANGVDITVVAELMGHANIRMLQEVYAHAIEERKLNAANILDLMYATR